VSLLSLIEVFSAQTLQQTTKASTPTTNDIDEKKAARLAKLEAWKKNQAEEQAKKEQEIAGPGGARNLLEEIDKRDALTPTAPSPTSPATPEVASPAPYAGKFDPKAIAKKVHSSSTIKGVLGADIAAPKLTNGVSAAKAAPAARPASPLVPAPSSLKPKGNLSRFGLASKSATETDKSKTTLDFDDDESDRKKLAKLPSLPTDATNGTMADSPESNNDAEDDGDHDLNMQEGEADEGALAAARAAAEQRSQAERGEDTTMAEAPVAEADAMEGAEEEEELDPLDAFMSDLTAVPAKPGRQTNGPTTKSNRQQEPEAIYSDDDVDVTAIDEDNPDSIMNAANEKIRKKKRDIPTVNHAKMTYEPYRRSFYSEPADMADWTEEEVLNLRHELDGIKVRGVDVPKPVQNWAQCGLGVQTLDVIQKLGYEYPTSIQAQAIPAIMSGRDVIGVAKTGSGKTVAFLLPMLRHIKDQRPLEGTDGPIGLILSPTRELATQIHKECKPFAKALGLRAVCAYGGAPIKDQIADLKRGAEVVVCTVGRMIDLLAANAGRVTNLRRVTYVVLDEADRMFDMGFEPQVMKIMANVRPDRQTVLFSATFPRNMEALARKTLSKPVEIIVGGRSVVAPEITQLVEVKNEDQKFHRLLELLGNLYEHEENADDRALIFVNRQEAADLLLRDLMRKGYPCMSIHGGKDQIDRDSTIDDFKAGIVPILIATSVAARGLDVKQLKLVVNYDAPNHLEDYVHRAGRTGRAGNKGTAVTFLTSEEERYSVDIAKALRQSGQPIPEQVQKMVESFIDKVKSGKEKASGSGFGGKGLERLDQERDATKARERKTFKTGDEPDEEEKEEKDDEKTDEQFLKAASTVKALEEKPAQLAGVPKGIDLDGEITVNKTVRETPGGPVGKMDKVAAAVAGINNKLSKAGVMRQGVPIDNKGPDAGAFHATLEINDFPQKARWAVTNRTNVAKILDSTGTSITTKGNYYPTGKDPGPNDAPKLYILVEGDTELVVKEAMREMMRLLKEGTMAAADSDGGRTAGRYSVV
jgi:ATP-dependent RNA helicase DDX46/PRP5